MLLHLFLKRVSYCSLLLLSLWLIGCASTTNMGNTTGSVNSWTAKGKLGIRHNNTAQSLNFIWKNNDQDFDIHMYGSLGIGNVRISKTGETVSLRSNKGTRYADSPERLLREITGWDLPVSTLQHWILGKASPISDILTSTQDDIGRLRSLEQEGWTIQYKRYHKGSGLLPKNIVAKRANLTLTIVIKSWQ